MPVIVKYVVVREGKEVMEFSDKKEADAYDKLLDAAYGISELIEKSGIEIDEDSTEKLSIYLAENANEMMTLLKPTIKLKPTKKTSVKPNQPVEHAPVNKQNPLKKSKP